MAIINFPILYIPDPEKGRPLFFGQIFVGEPDLDPQVLSNQKQLNIVQEDGTKIPVNQPLLLSAGGVPVYNGGYVRLDVDGNFSIKILDKNGAQTYYIENVYEGQPITEETIDIALANTLSQTYNFATVAEFKSSTIEFPDGKRVFISENKKYYKVIPGTTAGDTNLIIASNEVDQSLEFFNSSDNNYVNVEDMKASKTINAGDKVITDGYYYELDGGDAEYIATTGGVADEMTDHTGQNGIVLKMLGDVVDIRKAGCQPGDYSFDNADRIKSAILKGRGVIPNGIFYSTPIRLNTDFNNKSLVGLGIGSNLSLIDATPSGGSNVPLVHIPQNGGAYGGTEEGAIGFYCDQFSMSGLDATGTASTTGLVVENSVAFQFGTIWSYGFYKSGGILTGTCTQLKGGTFYGYNNGNQVGANTGGQGLAFSLTDSEDPQGKIDNVICYNNGISNFGQALDWVEGNLHVGTLHGYDNGSSCMKIVRADRVRVDSLISQSNNKHTGNGFPCLYTNGDFGVANIGYFESDNSASSAISHTKSGSIKIGTANISNSGSNSIALQAEPGKSPKLTIGELSADNPTTNLINQTGDSYLKVGIADLMNCPNQGVILNGTETRISQLTVTDSVSVPLWLRGGDVTISDAKIENTTLSGSTAVLIDAAVSNASIPNMKSKGYTTTLTDNGTATYKPNVVNT